MTLDAAVSALHAGDVVAFPTDTVYGLGADPGSERAVARLYELKGRPPAKALPLLLLREWLPRVAAEVPGPARALMDAFWPGGLTLVLEARESVPPWVRAGASTVACREPDHPLTQDLLRGFGGPLASTSANLSGQPECRSADQVASQLPALRGRILDGGPTPGGRPSSVLDLSSAPPRLLREGALTLGQLRRVVADLEAPR